MELVLCILIRVDDGIQTAQCIDVVRFLSNIESFPENQVCESGKSSREGSETVLVLSNSEGGLELGERSESRTIGTNGRYITCDRS
jgi:hypothetical protein